MNRVLESWKEIGQDSINLPNFLTLVRICLIPVFVVVFLAPTPDRSWMAAVIFTVAAVTDLLDGYIARRTGQVTKLGQLLAIRTSAGIEKRVTADFFPAYNEDGGLMIALSPR